MNNLTVEQWQVIARYGLVLDGVIDNGIAVCEFHHPNGVADVYIEQDGGICVEEGDDLDGYELIPLADSFMSGILSDY